MNAPGMQRSTRATGPYRYSYADPREVGPVAPLVLELWIPKGRKGGQWVAHHAAPVGNYTGWRKVRRFHSHPDKLSHSAGPVKSCGYALDVEKQVELYMAWAQSRGLTRVHAFAGCKVAHATRARAFGLSLVLVDPAEFIGPAPAPEVDDSEREAA